MFGINLKDNEAIRLAQVPNGGEFRITRALTPGYRRNFNCSEEARPAMIAALLQVGPYQPGKEWYAKEAFTVKFNEPRNETWITWVADRGIANGASIHGRTPYADGTFSPVIMPRYASRCVLKVQKVEVVYDSFEPSRDGIAAGRQVPMRIDWCWAITFLKVAR